MSMMNTQTKRDRHRRKAVDEFHGFQSLAGLNGPDGRMGSPEIAALNLVHAGAEYWELWHGDGFSVTTSSQAASVWREAGQLGYEAYKKKLIAEGQYRQRR